MAQKAGPKPFSPIVTTILITKARMHLGALVTRVHLNKEYVILEKDGLPVSRIMDLDEFEDYLELQDPKVRAIIVKGRQEYLAGKSRPVPVEDLLRELQDRKGGKVRRRQLPAFM